MSDVSNAASKMVAESQCSSRRSAWKYPVELPKPVFIYKPLIRYIDKIVHAMVCIPLQELFVAIFASENRICVAAVSI